MSLRTRVSLACLMLTVPSAISLAQETYRLPPPEVIAIVDAPPSPSVTVSPDGQWMLLLERAALPSIADLSRRMLRLAGMRIDPAANGRYRTSYAKGLTLEKVTGTATTKIPLAPGKRLLRPTGSTFWSRGSSGRTRT